MAGVLKKTTGLTGLLVEPHPHRKLRILYTRILKALSEAPKTAAYRKHTEPLIEEKLAHVNKVSAIDELEKKLGHQVEECIQMAENELLLSRRMLVWKPWEPLQTQPPEDQWKWPM